MNEITKSLRQEGQQAQAAAANELHAGTTAL
jgi:hypothetical protein